jgi:glycosyltransferase involved in cell wall biosynthesis
MNFSRTHYPLDLSIIAPVYNEEDSIKPLYLSIKKTLDSFSESYEIIFVDDGSRDGTLKIAEILAQRDPHLRVIAFRKNCGQTPAMAAGIDHASGNILVTMDGDLQNDPSDIPQMVARLLEGFDIVIGWRHQRQDKFLSRKLPSIVANWLIGKVTGVAIKDNGCSLKVYRSEVMKSMPFYSEMHRFIPAVLSLSGARVSEVKVKHHARQYGYSKYGISRVFKVLADLISVKTLLSLTGHPVRWFTKLAFIPVLISILSVYHYLAVSAAGSSTMIMASMIVIWFSLAIFLLSLGLLCELTYKQGTFDLSHVAPLTAKYYKVSKFME